MELLLELLDRPLKWEHYDSDQWEDDYRFEVEDVGTYEVSINDIGDESGDGLWEVEFSIVGSEDPHAIIGTRGKQIQIFSTVKDIVDDFLLRRGREVKTIMFSAKEPSRIKLYRRFANLLGKSEEKKSKEGATEFYVKV